MNTIALYQLLAFLSTGGEAATSRDAYNSRNPAGSSREALEELNKAQAQQHLEQQEGRRRSIRTEDASILYTCEEETAKKLTVVSQRLEP